MRQQALCYGLPQLDVLHPREFEYAVRDLMLRDGCTDARQIGEVGDDGADVLATDPMGRRWVIQSKRRKNGDRGSAVGTPDLQRVNGTDRRLDGADVVLVVTNDRFTTRCAASRILATWASGGALCGNCSRRFPRPARAGSPCGDRCGPCVSCRNSKRRRPTF
ncbi:restriction endonuclease [Streptomyces anulatus]